MAEGAYRETTVLFGETKMVVGIVTDPPEGTPSRGLGCLLLNAGYIHRVGPQRLHVKLARRLALAGIVTIRFDYSGVGDSPMRRDNLQFADAAISEAQEAMDFLASSRGIERFVTAGICWGGDNALRVCHADQRVIGAAPIEFYALPSTRQWLRLYLRRALSPRSWANLFGGRSPVLRRGIELLSGALRTRARNRGAAPEEVVPIATVRQILHELGIMAERGQQLYFVFTRAGPSWDHYLKRFRRGLEELVATGRVKVELFQCDHIFTLLHDQDQLMRRFIAWSCELADRSGASVQAS